MQPSRNPVASTVPRRRAGIKPLPLFSIWLLYGLYRDSIGYIGLLEPLSAALAKAACQGVFGMRADTREDPGRCVAEAFADVFAPTPGAAPRVARFERPLAPLRGPAQFAAGPAPHFLAEQRFVGPAARVAQPQPHEVENLMDEDAVELLRVGGQLRVERDASFTDERAGVHTAAAVCERAADFQPDRFAVHGRERGADFGRRERP